MSGFSIKDQKKYFQPPKPVNENTGKVSHKLQPGRAEALERHKLRIQTVIHKVTGNI